MVIFLPLFTSSTPHSGYTGNEQDISRLNLPPLPGGWHWKVKDTGGRDSVIDRLLGYGVASIWLYGPHSIYSQDSNTSCSRQPEKLRKAANKIIKRSTEKAAIYGPPWTDFNYFA